MRMADGGDDGANDFSEDHSFDSNRWSSSGARRHVSRPQISKVIIVTTLSLKRSGLDTGLVSIRSQSALATQPTALLDHRGLLVR